MVSESCVFSLPLNMVYVIPEYAMTKKNTSSLVEYNTLKEKLYIYGGKLSI